LHADRQRNLRLVWHRRQQAPLELPRPAARRHHSDTGRDCRDASAGIVKTCRKLGIAFWDYLGARLGMAAASIPYLPDLIRCRAQLA
jgi:hypothetical protein